jgi:hypothetical protein
VEIQYAQKKTGNQIWGIQTVAKKEEEYYVHYSEYGIVEKSSQSNICKKALKSSGG